MLFNPLFVLSFGLIWSLLWPQLGPDQDHNPPPPNLSDQAGLGCLDWAGRAGLVGLGWAELAAWTGLSQSGLQILENWYLLVLSKDLLVFYWFLFVFLVQSQHFVIFCVFSLFFQRKTNNVKQNVRKFIGNETKH